MAHRVEALFRDDAYRKDAEATVVSVTDEGGVILDRTIFYATSGGQPGDTGALATEDGRSFEVSDTVCGASKEEIIHRLSEGSVPPAVGTRLKLTIDWDRRYRLMRMHTACHLLSVVCPQPITGASVSESDSRVDFDMPEGAPSKEEVTAKLMELVEADHPVFTRLISQEELAANPGLVKSKNVRPPTGAGQVRLVCIGEDAAIDSQPCGGTHVARTGEIGEIHIGKIEKKGRENRRFRIRFGQLSQ
ncbi:alanyl-tRNA editing protein [Nitratireductor basaltis]|uniref:Alanine--tRNA ligase n=1 Tax=Nitratireductor basaltis TaxID=472175 RepID=A0A084UA67_9HYPH|nr:alanyl-tRNA editing protein [Nitratireductor basaltis]KFB09853.1 Alanyl-tRNA synthetase [Nitratireductor basaltis]